MNRTYNERDWETHRALVADDFELIDHHSIGVGVLEGGDAVVEYMEPMTDLAPDLKIFTVEYLGLAPDRLLAHLRSVGHTADGARVEREFYATGIIADGKLLRSEKWDLEDRGAAFARWQELLEPPQS